MRTLKLLTSGLTIALLTALSSGGLARNTGLLFVSSERTDSVVIVDLETKRIVKYLKTSRLPRDMHFNTDHTYLYVACAGDDSIDIVDVGRRQALHRVEPKGLWDQRDAAPHLRSEPGGIVPVGHRHGSEPHHTRSADR